MTASAHELSATIINEFAMRIKVTKKGVVIPKQLLEGVKEIEILKQLNMLLIFPVTGDDPIYQLGVDPLTVEIDDASINHDEIP